MMSSSSRAHRSLSPSSPSLFSPEDYSGIVVETTPDTLASHPHLTVGTPVFGLHLTAGTGSSHGSLSTHLTLRPSSPASSAVVPLHTDISHVDAASLPLVWITAYTALVKYGLLDTQPGRGNERRTVVIVGASGGAGSYAVQVAKKLLGVGTVIGVCSSRNAKFVSEELGADVVLEYDQEPEGVAAGLRRLMPEGGYDVVFDCVGGTEVVNQYRQLCKRGGAGGFVTIVGDKSNREYVPPHISLPRSRSSPPNLAPFAVLASSTLGGAYTNLTNPFQLFRTFLGWLGLAPRYHCIDLIPSVASLEAILPLLIKPGGLTIPIDSVHAFTEEGVKAGFERLDSGRVKGKVVVKVKED